MSTEFDVNVRSIEHLEFKPTCELEKVSFRGEIKKCSESAEYFEVFLSHNTHSYIPKLICLKHHIEHIRRDSGHVRTWCSKCNKISPVVKEWKKL